LFAGDAITNVLMMQHIPVFTASGHSALVQGWQLLAGGLLVVPQNACRTLTPDDEVAALPVSVLQNQRSQEG
jgi:hypothetical protein